MAAPHHRHQISLQGFVNLSASPPLADTVRVEAGERFHQIIDHFTASDTSAAAGPTSYNRPELDNVLRAFFRAIELPMDGPAIDLSDNEQAEALRARVAGFAGYLVDNFFLPLRASTARTPQPTPHYRSATLRSSSHDFVGTPERLSTLRGDCLTRDGHRCVISRAFDMIRARERETPEGWIVDDVGEQIVDSNVHYLEVAHILPHSLVHVASDEELSETKRTALEILNMFDNDVAHLINGVDIDRPHNALTLTLDLHRAFGAFDIYFTQIPDRPHTYRIETFRRIGFQVMFPVTRTLYLSADQSIDPPAPRLLALHRAIGHILHLSGAGSYIDNILRKFEEEQLVQCNGSTPLGESVQLRLNRWDATAINS
ncbi:HNH endonuclease domain-containing protein [Cordyceps javanica]|uniref:HNH endonuclease domain-containing protein n=1 Tax=Cordyceps javanica TaxID=43265 RepID=A0A545VIL5_9HYPO|nr:HNH endonuclease domain-containing protein [Cordyceps javanica]TQW01568.1 HNH endonuclease domain-containing protein [Cordyceps javanica]